MNPKSQLKIWLPAGLSSVEFISDSGAPLYPDHVHDAFTLDLIISGRMEYRVGPSRFMAEQGSLVWIDSCEVHGGQAIGSTPLVLRSILFPQPFMAGVEDYSSRVISDPLLFYQACLVHFAIESGSVIDLEARLSELLLQITGVAENRSSLRNQKEHKAISAIKSYMIAHFEEPISIRKIAGWAGLSTPHFVRAFRREVGLPPYAYLTQLRVARARLLLQRGMAPADVALTVGLSDQSHLTRFFKRTTGITPGFYRKKVSGEQ